MLVTFYLSGPYSATTVATEFTIVGNPGAETYTGVTKTQLLTGHSLTFSESVTGGTVTATNATCNTGTYEVAWSVSAPEPTPTGLSLEIRARDVASIQQTLTMYYSINSGGNVNIPGATATLIPISCTPIITISGLAAGDTVTIGTSTSCAMTAAQGTSCPSMIGSLPTYTYTMDTPTTQVVSVTLESNIVP